MEVLIAKLNVELDTLVQQPIIVGATGAYDPDSTIEKEVVRQIQQSS